MFDREGPAAVNTMHELTSGVFENIYINSPMDVEKIVAYTQRILICYAIKKYKAVLVECKQLAKDLAVGFWDLVEMNEISTNNLWNWANKDITGYDGDD